MSADASASGAGGPAVPAPGGAGGGGGDVLAALAAAQAQAAQAAAALAAAQAAAGVVAGGGGAAGGGAAAPANADWVPADARSLWHWLQGADGPQDTFAQAVDAQMRGVGIIKTPAPNPYTDFHLQEIWATIEDIPSPPLTVAEFSCGAQVYKADPREWWKRQGVPLVRKICQYARIDAGGSNLTVKEASGKTLSQDECVHIVSTAQWQAFRAAVNAGDVAMAIASIDGKDTVDMQIMRGTLMVADCVGVKIKETEREKKVVFSVLRGFEAIVNRVHQGTIKSNFVTRAIVPLNFVEDVRNLISGIDDVRGALRGGMAELLECKVTELKDQPYAAINLALRTVVQCWYTMIGSPIGDEAVRNVTSPVTEWALQDGTFARWVEFISTGPHTKPCAMSLIEAIIMPRLVEWFDVYWSALRGAVATGPATTLAAFFEPREWMRVDFDYMEMRKVVRGLQRSGGGNTKPRKLCNFCVQQGIPANACRHDEKDCFIKDPMKKKPKRKAPAGGPGSGSLSKKKQRQAWMDAGKCLKCGSPDHRKAECDGSGPGYDQ